MAVPYSIHSASGILLFTNVHSSVCSFLILLASRRLNLITCFTRTDLNRPLGELILCYNGGCLCFSQNLELQGYV
jgi:hypothetical protein